jgi:RimJ/RimL family protein N-acetyltransferase
MDALKAWASTGRNDPRRRCVGIHPRAYWGRGLATEAARAFLDFGFRELRLRRIVASVQAGNMASTHILEKLGFHLWGLERANGRCFYHLERFANLSR